MAWAHIATGLALATLAIVRLRTRLGLARRVLRRPRSWRRLAFQASSRLLIAAALAVTVTGLLRWVGLSPEQTWHGGTGWFLAIAVLLHLWLIRHRLRQRLRRGGSTQ